MTDAATPTRSPSAAERAAQRGLARDWDFLLHLPLRYVDQTRIAPIAGVVDGMQAQVQGTLADVRIVVRRRRQLLARLVDDSGELLLRWVNFYPSLQARLVEGRTLRALGLVRGALMGLEMIHPQISLVEPGAALPAHLTPVYPAGEGIGQAWLRRRIHRILEAGPVADSLGPAWRERLAVMDLDGALRLLHEPPAADDEALARLQAPAWQRLRCEELLVQQLALRRARSRRRSGAAVAMARGGSLTQRLLASLPFALTADQRGAWQQIEADLAGQVPMNRLLQGDVGSGKTVVAALAAARAIESGHQAALMAPTGILAEQHFQRIAALLQPLGVEVAWLGGRSRETERRATLAAIEGGGAQLVVGTHALIQEPVRFARLGLAIVDEQHRFGVEQRMALREGPRSAHLLMLSATPIPRTLAMTYLADLDVSVIRERPPGRSPVRTKLIAGARRHEVLHAVRAEVAAGRQAYWVCPLVEENEQVEATAAVQMVEHTRALLPELRLGLLHGQMPASEKSAVMAAFAQRSIDVLVATTVVEVGVDVPNASLMVIEHAQRFGLATLHQLRGRVGRGSIQSTCVLLFDEPLSDLARERLRVLHECDDGFEIAQRDLALRGPGEFLGARQWGMPMLRFADLERDAGRIEGVRDLADAMLAQEPARAADLVERWFPQAAQYLGA